MITVNNSIKRRETSQNIKVLYKIVYILSWKQLTINNNNLFLLLQHPGGDEIMMEYAGRDASTAFRSSGHSRMAVKALDRFLIGELPMQERLYRRPGGIRLSDIPE